MAPAMPTAPTAARHVKSVVLDNLLPLISSNAANPRVFVNWTTNIETETPISRPKNDKALGELIVAARNSGSTVRIMGSGHSVSECVTSTDEAMGGGVTICQLNKYSAAPGFTDFSADLGTVKVWVNAGWSLAMMYSRMRTEHPRLLLPSQTAGPFFALGGVVANCVHGGNARFGLLADAVTALRIMDANGKVRMVSDEPELRLWRCSLCQLGVITHVEFQCILVGNLLNKSRIVSTARDPVQPTTCFGCCGAVPPPGSSVKALVDPAEVRKNILTDLDTEPWQEYFWNPYTGSLLRLSWEASKLPPDGVADGDPSSSAAGAPKLKFLDLWPQKLPLLGEDARWSVDGCVRVIDTAFGDVENAIQQDQFTDDDMFYLEYASESVFLSYFIPVDPALNNVVKALRVVATVAKRLRDSDAPYKLDLPCEFRFVRGSSRAVLSPIYTEGVQDPAAGPLFMSIEVPTFTGGSIDPTLAKQDGAPMRSWLAAFEEIEQGFKAVSPKAQPHYAKFYGLKRDAGGRYSTFDPAVSRGIVPEARKAQFRAAMARLDPTGVFENNFGKHLVGSSAVVVRLGTA